MLFLITETIRHPETNLIIVEPFDLIDLEGMESLSVKYGVDTVSCIMCTSFNVAETIARAMIAEK